MTLDVLISTFSDRITNLSLPDKKEGVRYIIVHQKYRAVKTLPDDILKRSDVKYIKTETVGLTKSRNIALESSDADLKLIADDDIAFLPNFDKVIKDSYQKYKFDVGVFKIKSIGSGSEFRKYPSKDKWYNKIDCLNVCSIEMVITKSCNTKFDESFGIGGKYLCGEESIYLFDTIRKKRKIKYISKYIVSHPLESTVVTGGSKVLEAKGAVLKYGFGRLLSLIFIMKLSVMSRFNKIYNINRIDVFRKLMAGWYED